MDEITHELGDGNWHRLIVNGVPGEWFPETELAIGGTYYGTQGHLGGVDFAKVVGGEYPVVFTLASIPFTGLPNTKDRKALK